MLALLAGAYAAHALPPPIPTPEPGTIALGVTGASVILMSLRRKG